MIVIQGFLEWLLLSLASLFSFLWSVLVFLFLIGYPVTNFFVWKSNLRPNIKLTYISASSLLSLGIMMLVELRRGAEVSPDLAHRFDPALMYYPQSEAGQPLRKVVRYQDTLPEAMGLDTCIDPEGNIIDLKKRVKLEKAWFILEIPNEYLRKESIDSILQRGGIKSSYIQDPETLPADRKNKIKLEDFKFMKEYIKDKKLKVNGLEKDGILFFELDNVDEDKFGKYIKEIKQHQKESVKKLTVLFSTSDNYLTNRLKSIFELIRF